MESADAIAGAIAAHALKDRVRLLKSAASRTLSSVEEELAAGIELAAGGKAGDLRKGGTARDLAEELRTVLDLAEKLRTVMEELQNEIRRRSAKAAGIGEVHMGTGEEAMQAVQVLNGSQLGGATIEVKMHEETKLAITGIPTGVSLQNLEDHFGQCGTVKHADTDRYDADELLQALRAQGGPGEVRYELKDHFASMDTLAFADVHKGGGKWGGGKEGGGKVGFTPSGGAFTSGGKGGGWKGGGGGMGFSPYSEAKERLARAAVSRAPGSPGRSPAPSASSSPCLR